MKRILVTLVCLLGAIGCGEATSSGGSSSAGSSPSASASASPSGSAALPDPCQLVTHADAETVAGSPLQDAVEGNPNNPSCTYTAKPTDPTAQVETHLGDGAKKTYDIDVALKHTFTDVPGLADEAHAETNAIFFRKGQLWVSIAVLDHRTSEENARLLLALAGKVAALI